MPNRPKEPISGTISFGKIAFSHRLRMFVFILSQTSERISSHLASSSSESSAPMFEKPSSSGDRDSGDLEPVLRRGHLASSAWMSGMIFAQKSVV